MHLKKLQIEAGAVFEDVAGVTVPVHFGDVDREYRSVASGTGLVDRSLLGKVRLTGKDRARFLHGMVTNTVLALAESEGNHAALTTARGQTLMDLWISNLGTYLWLETDPGMQKILCETLTRYLIADDVDIQDETEQWGILGLVGDRSAQTVREAFGIEVSGLIVNQTRFSDSSSKPIWITRRSAFGRQAFDLRISPEHLAEFWERSIQIGASPLGFRAQEILRVEAGIPRCGLEIDESVAPLETGLKDTVDFDKGCYIGQEVIAKMHFRGQPRRYLAGLRIKAHGSEDLGADVTVDGKIVGRITSSVFSPSLSGVIALAILRRGSHEVGQRVRVGDAEAEVVQLPFVSPEAPWGANGSPSPVSDINNLT
ncbi:MAG: hypothetical protein O3B73_10915 [bacterium]|nr:hypothetical protein [bacterium]